MHLNNINDLVIISSSDFLLGQVKTVCPGFLWQIICPPWRCYCSHKHCARSIIISASHLFYIQIVSGKQMKLNQIFFQCLKECIGDNSTAVALLVLWIVKVCRILTWSCYRDFKKQTKDKGQPIYLSELYMACGWEWKNYQKHFIIFRIILIF